MSPLGFSFLSIEVADKTERPVKRPQNQKKGGYLFNILLNLNTSAVNYLATHETVKSFAT